VIDWLLQRMREAGEHPALAFRDREMSYRWMCDRVENWMARLDVLGVGRDVVSIESDYSADACAVLLALIQRQCIVVPLDPRLPDVRTEHALRVADVQVRLRAADRWRVDRIAGVPSHALIAKLLADGRPGLVLFTTGSTGEPLAALHDVARLLKRFEVPRQGRRTITFLLFDHIGGQNTLFHTLASTGTLVLPDGRHPDAVCQAIESHRVELLPTSPTFLNLLLLSEAHRRYDLSSLTTITYGTEPMPEATLQRLREVLPQVRLLQTYGLTELGILKSASRSSDSLWVRLGGEGIETRVVDGRLHVRAGSAMLGYLNAPSPYDDEGWMDTRDVVEVDGEYVRFLGRQSEVINVGGLKVYPAEVEGVLLELPYVADVTVRGEAHPITGQIVVARVTLAADMLVGELRRRLRSDCADRLEPWKIPSKVEVAAGLQHGERFKRRRVPPCPEAV